MFLCCRSYFVYVGTIEPRKNLVFLLEAYERFRAESPDRVLLVVVGQRGWKSEAFFAQLEIHPFREDIVLTGYLEKQLLPQAYHHSLALIYPSVYEGFGFPILEAMACGTNVICPDNSSLPEVGGALAFYYPTEDVKALIQQMHQVSSGGGEVMKRRKQVEGWAVSFSWPDYAVIFNEAMSRMQTK